MKKENCETCKWRESEIGYPSPCPTHEDKIKRMTLQELHKEIIKNINETQGDFLVPDLFDPKNVVQAFSKETVKDIVRSSLRRQLEEVIKIVIETETLRKKDMPSSAYISLIQSKLKA